jgi:hypothetical protein
MSNIFISYASQDGEQVDPYYESLLRLGHNVWMDRAALKGGQEWRDVIQERIRWSDTMIVMWSAHALTSNWVRLELTYAHTLKKRIIPVQIDDTPTTEDMIVNSRQTIDGRARVVAHVVNDIEVALDDVAVGPPAGPAAVVHQRPVRWVVIGAMVLLVAAVLITLALVNQPAVTVTPTVTTPLPAGTPDASLRQPLTLDLLNEWRARQGLAALAVNPALEEAATQHVSYLRSLPLAELERTNLFRNAEGRDMTFMAESAGYTGTVTLLVEVTDGEVTLADVVDWLEDPAQYDEAGWHSVRAISTGKLYFALILGTRR